VLAGLNLRFRNLLVEITRSGKLWNQDAKDVHVQRFQRQIAATSSTIIAHGRAVLANLKFTENDHLPI
jgi:hypothetical protein